MKSALLASFVLTPAVWSAAVARDLRSMSCDEPRDVVASLECDVAEGRARVSRISQGEAVRGFVVFSLTSDHELIVHAAFGKARENLMNVLVPLVDQLARACECATVRFDTRRPGLVRRALEHGFRISSVCMRKAVP